MMNSKRQVKGKLGHVVQIHVCRLPQTRFLISLIIQVMIRYVLVGIFAEPVEQCLTNSFYFTPLTFAEALNFERDLKKNSYVYIQVQVR